MLICIKDCHPKYDTIRSGQDNYYIRANSLFSKYHKSMNRDSMEPSWTIYSELFPEMGGFVYDFENFITLDEWRRIKIDLILEGGNVKKFFSNSE